MLDQVPPSSISIVTSVTPGTSYDQMPMSASADNGSGPVVSVQLATPSTGISAKAHTMRPSERRSVNLTSARPALPG